MTPLCKKVQGILIRHRDLHGMDAVTQIVYAYGVRRISEMSDDQLRDAICKYGDQQERAAQSKADIAVEFFVELWQKGAPLKEAFIAGAAMLHT